MTKKQFPNKLQTSKFKTQISFWSLFVSCFLFLVTSLPIAAQSPTSATIRDTVKQQVESELSQIKSAVSKKAYVGSVTAKADGVLTINNLQNQPRSVTLTTDAAIKLTSGKDGTPADVKIGDFVIAMGDADGQGMLTVKRLLVTAKPSADTRQTVAGSVSKISPSSITLKTPDGKEVTARLLGSTKYTGATKVTDIKTDSQVAFITTGATTLTVVHLHLFP